MDIKTLEFPDNYFDYVVDKSTLDVLFCGDNSSLNAAIALNEIQRVLKPQGLDLMVSFGSAENRLKHLQKEHLSFDIRIFSLRKSLLQKQGVTESVVEV